MTLLSSGQISIGGSTSGRSINLELGRSATAQSSLGETTLRTLAGVASGEISLSSFYGKSNEVLIATQTYNTVGTYYYTIPAGTTNIEVITVGGGGGGAAAYEYYYIETYDEGPVFSESWLQVGGGGGSGAGIRAKFTAEPGIVLTISVGSRGGAGSANLGPGNANGSSGQASVVSYLETLYDPNTGEPYTEYTIYTLAGGGGPGGWDVGSVDYGDYIAQFSIPSAGAGGSAGFTFGTVTALRYLTGTLVSSSGQPGTLTLNNSQLIGGNGGSRTAFYGVSGSGGAGGNQTFGAAATGQASGGGGGGKTSGGILYGGALGTHGTVIIKSYQ